MRTLKFVLITLLVTVALLSIVIWYFPSIEDFLVDNPFWNGLKDLTNTHNIRSIYSLAELPEEAQNTSLIFIPYLKLTENELEQISTFLKNGGTLIVADDFGYGNQILQHLQLKVRFSRSMLLDPLFSYKNSIFPRISNFSKHPITGDVQNILLNHPTILLNVLPENNLASSSLFSYLDLNDNELPNENEPLGPFPVMALYPLHRGKVIIISDPSIFINTMINREDNNILIKNLLKINTLTIFSQSHLPLSLLPDMKLLLQDIRKILQSPLGTLSLIVVIFSISLLPLFFRRRNVKT
ncbi:MAG: hypothetical protein DDT40_01795 [candidate division WS2 bacterium]|uniref:DUF4350 domain-containing protein n=1 Tax=Psychracetigena formicireducens TaxID=2986056 RepID=A0A9E2BJE8_PSYF1|nr:hypothetical protein [Candidatus Psychracetigena formicireducens]MBT9151599.1 hypothetical protein [Candidatus Psychracetigena formicireducens]